MTPAFSLTRHVTDFSALCGIPAHACLCVALFICHPPYPILPSQWRPPVETQNLASPVLSITINVCTDSVMINAFFSS